MATWQFDLQLVPRKAVERNGGVGQDHLEPSAMESVSWWEGTTLPPEARRQVESLLPWRAPWDPEWKVFGEEDGNRIDIIEEHGCIAELRARVDARDLDLDFIEAMIRFAEDWELVLLTTEGRIIMPNVDAFWVELMISPASRFVHDPEGYLNWLKQRRKGP